MLNQSFCRLGKQNRSKMRAFVLVGLFVSVALARSVEKKQLHSHCLRYCPSSYEPVCGSDGKTYPNMCFFGEASCQYAEKGQTLRVVQHGACGATQTGHVDTANCDQLCDEDRKPLCASDGVVYDNLCKYQRAECEAAKNNTRLSIVLYGDSCPTPTTPDCDQYHLNTSDIALEGDGSNFMPRCPSTADYQCGSDGHSYGNECQLCHHMEQTGESLMISYAGVCHTSTGGHGFNPYQSIWDLLHNGDPIVG